MNFNNHSDIVIEEIFIGMRPQPDRIDLAHHFVLDPSLQDVHGEYIPFHEELMIPSPRSKKLFNIKNLQYCQKLRAVFLWVYVQLLYAVPDDSLGCGEQSRSFGLVSPGALEGIDDDLPLIIC